MVQSRLQRDTIRLAARKIRCERDPRQAAALAALEAARKAVLAAERALGRALADNPQHRTHDGHKPVAFSLTNPHALLEARNDYTRARATLAACEDGWLAAQLGI